MKHLKLIIFVFLILIFPNKINAQENSFPVDFSLFVGMNVPTGNFGDGSIIENPNALGAYTGFSTMLDASIMLNDRFFWNSSASISFNGTKLVTDDYDDNFTTSLFLTGFGVQSVSKEQITFYGIGQVGLMISSLPDLVNTYSTPISIISYDLGKAFAYSIGLGAKYKLLHFTLRYNNAKPSFEREDLNGEKINFDITISFVQAMIGINF